MSYTPQAPKVRVKNVLLPEKEEDLWFIHNGLYEQLWAMNLQVINQKNQDTLCEFLDCAYSIKDWIATLKIPYPEKHKEYKADFEERVNRLCETYAKEFHEKTGFFYIRTALVASPSSASPREDVPIAAIPRPIEQLAAILLDRRQKAQEKKDQVHPPRR